MYIHKRHNLKTITITVVKKECCVCQILKKKHVPFFPLFPCRRPRKGSRLCLKYDQITKFIDQTGIYVQIGLMFPKWKGKGKEAKIFPQFKDVCSIDMFHAQRVLNILNLPAEGNWTTNKNFIS